MSTSPDPQPQPAAESLGRLLRGALAIALNEPNAMAYFELSEPAFWRSFKAAGYAAPIYLALLALIYANWNPERGPIPDATGFLVVKMLVFFVNWAAFAVAMIWISKVLDLGARYVPFIIAWNWCGLLAHIVLLPLATIASIGVLPTGLAGFLGLSVFLAAVFYGYRVASIAFGCPIFTAIGVVAFELVLNLLFDGLGSLLL